MDTIQKIRYEACVYISEPGNLLQPLETKVNVLFNKLNFDSIWCALINLLTFGWYNDHNKGLIRDVLKEDFIISASGFTPKPFSEVNCGLENEEPFYNVGLWINQENNQ